ncbi:dnaJ homolog subfamily C member 28 isoform X2 [Ricinus communis]|uniref:dnaJ homolog subfamily C member 28 isoform X2 n=1 Tax=Ricinus communis TaxID=3988 RepID=UPI00201AF5F6|nr:dnaJ homolog subfamily C member 28 isoform X2 [Ricinus communis]
MAMATRFSRKALSSSSLTLITLLRKLTSENRRWTSSSSTSKPNKKMTDRLSTVIDAVNDRKLPPELRGQRNSVRSETDIINVVEQRIWHSMEEGHFENLPGKGKPLNLSSNPHADPAEDTLYRILSKNGCAPEWIELNKEIRSKVSEWRVALKKAWKTKCNGDHSKWTESSEALKAQLRDINNKQVQASDFACKWRTEKK